MAENKRIYEIRINGLQESYDGVQSLREALDSLTDTVVNVSKEEEKTVQTRKSTSTATDQLAKAQEKLNNWDKEYQTQLAETNAQLSSNKKEINATIKVQQAQEVVEAKQLDTYAQKQQYLSALNTLIRNHSTATEEDRAAIDGMVRESAALQAELKATDEQMKIYVRNVGNYPGAVKEVVESHKSLKSELKDLKAQMSEMLASGVSKTDEAYLKLAERAGFLKDAIKDANEDITNFASDTRGLTNAINLASSAVSAYQLYNSALQVFGDENEEAAKSIQKMMSVMTLLNSLQTVQNNLLENGSATARLYTKAVELVQAALGIKKTAVEENIAVTEAATVAEETNTVAQEMNATASEANATSTGIATTAETTNTGAITANTTATEANTVATNSMSVAQKAGAVASNILSVALRAIPLMAVIGLVMALIQNWESIWNWFKKTFPVLDNLSKKFNKLGGFMNAIVTGAKAVGAAVVNWLINPFKTFADVIGKILSGDFAGAWDAALNGIKNQFKGTADAFKNEVVKGYAKGQEEMTAKNATESNKRTKQELEELKIQERNNKTYSKKYIELQKKDFEERRKMAKGNKEELDKIKLEEMKFDAEVEDKKTAYAKSQANQRAKNAKAAAAAAKKETDAAKKEAEEWAKQVEDLVKRVEKAIEAGDKLWLDAVKHNFKIDDETYKKRLTDIEKNRIETYKLNLEYDKTKEKLESQIRSLKYVKNVQEEIYKKYKSVSLAKDIEKTTKSLNDATKAYEDFIEQSKFVIKVGTLNGEAIYRTLEWGERYKTTLELAEQETELFFAKRTEIAINSYLFEAVARKKEYKKQLEEYDKLIEETEEKEKKARTDADKKKLADHKAELAAERKLVDDSMRTLFGKYANQDIKIPVDLDLDNVTKKYNYFITWFKTRNKEIPFTLTEVVQAMLGITDKLSDDVRTIGEIWDTTLQGSKEDIGDFAQALKEMTGMTDEGFLELKDMLENGLPFDQVKDKVLEILTTSTINLKQFGLSAKEVTQLVLNMQLEQKKVSDEAYKDLVSKQDKIISNNEKIVKNFQDATRDIKFEPVMQDDVFSKAFKGQIINLDKTRDRYDQLEAAYQEYLDSIDEGSEQMKAREDAWQLKLEATKQKYGENSMEYRLMVDEKKKSDAAYAIEREKVSKQIEDIEKKQADLMYDYIQSITDRIADITKTIQDNVLTPIFDGLSDLFALQVEEAQDALDEVTKLYDKAVEAREESAERMKEINDELRADDGQNKEALQQRLAEEEVLLVQREEQERALAKEKAKRKYEVEVADYNQRKFELHQKLIEGLVNTALGVTSALKWGWPLGPVFAAIVGAMGALQTAIISRQIGNLKKPSKTFGEGGKVGEQGISRSHKQGGHRIEDTNIEVEGGEWVINKKSSQKYDTVLRAINEDNVNLVNKQIEIIKEKRVTRENVVRKFASGGQINTLTATKAVKENNQIEAITDLIRQIDFQPTVAVTDINKVNKNLVRVKQYAGSVG